MQAKLFGTTALVTRAAVDKTPAGVLLTIGLADRNLLNQYVGGSLLDPERNPKGRTIRVWREGESDHDEAACEVVLVPEEGDNPSFDTAICFDQREKDQAMFLFVPVEDLCPVAPRVAPLAVSTEADLMAGTLHMLREDLIQAGVVDRSVAAMFLTEAIFAALTKARAEGAEQINSAPVGVAKEADFDAMTWTFQIDRSCRTGAGRYALVYLGPASGNAEGSRDG